MTPAMNRLLANNLSAALDLKVYCNQESSISSNYMCHALILAANAGVSSEADIQRAQAFLSRWVRWMGHLTKQRTSCMVNIVYRLRYPHKEFAHHLFTEAWEQEGKGIEFYRGVIQRLNEKYVRRNAL